MLAQAGRAHKLPTARKPLNWDEWEDRLFQRLLEKQREMVRVTVALPARVMVQFL